MKLEIVCWIKSGGTIDIYICLQYLSDGLSLSEKEN